MADVVQNLASQILGQGTTSRWTGEGFGSKEANAREMAKTLAAAGITDINQFGKFKQIASHAGQAPSAVYPNDPNDPSKGYYTFEHVWDVSRPPGEEVVRSENKIPVDPSSIVDKSYDVYDETIGEFVTVKNLSTNTPVYEEVLGNKQTKQPISSDYDQRYGNIFSGTYTGNNQTQFGVQFTADGTPVFYTQEGPSTSNVGEIMQIAGLAMSIFAPGLGGAIGSAITGTAATTVISQVVGSAIVSGTMAELSGGNFADGAIKGAVSAGVAPLVAENLGAVVADAMGNSDFAKVVNNSLNSAASAAITTAILGGDVGEAALNAAVTSVGNTVGKELGGDIGAKLGTAAGKIVLGQDANTVLTSTIMDTLTSGVRNALKEDPLLAASSAQIGQGEVDAIKKHAEDAAANLNVAGTGDAATDQELVDIVAGQGNIANMMSGTSADVAGGSNIVDLAAIERERGQVTLGDIQGNQIDLTNVAPGSTLPEVIVGGSSKEDVDNILKAEDEESQTDLTKSITDYEDLQDDLEAQAVINGFPDLYTMEQYNGNIEDYLKDVAASRPSVITELEEPPPTPIVETEEEINARLEAKAALLGFPSYAVMQQYSGDIAAYNQYVADQAEIKRLADAETFRLTQEAETRRLSEIEEKRLADAEEIRQAAARAAGFPDAATFDEYAGDVYAYQSALEIKDLEKKQAEAEVLGFPDYATMQQYGGDIAKYNQDLADAKEEKRLADEEDERQRAADKKILDDAEFKRLADEAEDKRQSDARAAGFPDADTFDKYGGDLNAYSAAENQKLRDAAIAAGFPDAVTSSLYGGDIVAYRLDQENKAKLLDGNGLTGEAATDDDILKIVGGTGGDSLSGGDTVAGVDADGLLKLTPTEGDNRGEVASVLAGDDTLLDLTPTAGDDRGAVENVEVEDGLGNVESVVVGEDTLASTKDDILDGLLDLTPTEIDPLAVTPVIVENGLGNVESVVVGDDTLKAGEGDDILDGLIGLTPTKGDDRGLVENVIVENGLGGVESVVVDKDSLDGGVKTDTSLTVDKELDEVVDADKDCKTGFHKDEFGLCVSDEDKPEAVDCPEGKVRNLGTGECEPVEAVKPVITTVKPVTDPVTTTPPPKKSNPALDALLAGLATPQVSGEDDKETPFYGKMGPYMDIGADFDFLKPLGFDPKDALKRQQMNKMSVGGFIDALQAEEMTVDDLLSFLQQRN
jgi:hypothetical protein